MAPLRFIKSLYLKDRVFYILAVVGVLFLFSYWVHYLYALGWFVLWMLVAVFLFDLIALYRNGDGIGADRLLPDKFSNSDLNEIPVKIQNRYGYTIYLTAIDEVPVQFQKRDFEKHVSINSRAQGGFQYALRPVDRGEYVFGNLNLYAHTAIGLASRRYTFKKGQMVKVYPSFVQMKKYAFLAIDNKLSQYGLKKIRRLGHTMEFEQIKEYVTGDDVRTINWKATAKHGELMVNQYQDEKAQPIYSLIDSGRVMKMPFRGLSLLDYAINSTLAFSNVALKKGDKTGLLAFAETIKSHLPASSKKSHLNLILEVLYNIDTAYLDTDFGRLYAEVKRKIPHRSLLLLYTNFEHISSMERQMPYLRGLAKKHVLVVIFFENTELHSLIEQPAENTPEIYYKTIAQKMEYDKKLMVLELEKNGIQTVLTKPQDLTVNTINKYLEIKARGLI